MVRVVEPGPVSWHISPEVLHGDAYDRMAVDLLEAAETEAAREARSVREQLEHWARLGMHVSMRSTVARRRIENAVHGELSELPTEEREVANAELSVTTPEAANRTSFADHLAVEGVTTIMLDADGRLVERRSDGTTTAL